MEITRFIQDISHAPRHASGKVPAGLAQHDHPAARHVLATVVTHRLYYGAQTAVADAEPFPSHAADVRFTARRAVKGHVPDDDIVFRHEGGTVRWINDNLAPREAFAQVVVGISFQNE